MKLISLLLSISVATGCNVTSETDAQLASLKTPSAESSVQAVEASGRAEDKYAVVPMRLESTHLTCESVAHPFEVIVDCRFSDDSKVRMPITSLAKRIEFNVAEADHRLTIVVEPEPSANYDVRYSFSGLPLAELKLLVSHTTFQAVLYELTNGGREETINTSGADIDLEVPETT